MAEATTGLCHGLWRIQNEISKYSSYPRQSEQKALETRPNPLPRSVSRGKSQPKQTTRTSESPMRNSSKQPLKQQPTASNLANRPQFDNYVGIKHFDLYSENNEIIQKTKDWIRKQLEKCSVCPTFFVFAGIAGGTGSGLGSRIVQTVKEDFNVGIVNSFTIFPLFKGETPMQHYNCALALNQLDEFSDGIVTPAYDHRCTLAISGLLIG